MANEDDENFNEDMMGFLNGEDEEEQQTPQTEEEDETPAHLQSLQSQIDELRTLLSLHTRPLLSVFPALVSGTGWTERANDGDAWVAYADGRTSAALPLDLEATSAGNTTLLMEDKNNDTMRYVRMIAVGTAQFVALSSPSGSAGSQLTAPAFVYTVTTFGGSVVGSDMGPTMGRRNGLFSAATIGLGYFGADGVFVLVLAFETPGTSAECTPPG